MNNFGTALQEAREGAHTTLEQLANCTGIEVSRLLVLEITGIAPSVAEIFLLAQALNIDELELLENATVRPSSLSLGVRTKHDLQDFRRELNNVFAAIDDKEFASYIADGAAEFRTWPHLPADADVTTSPIFD